MTDTLLTTSKVSAQSGPEAMRPVHVRVIWDQDPARRARISWTTSGNGVVEHRVYLDTESHLDEGVEAYGAQFAPQLSGAYDDEDGASYHHTQVDGLEPSTRYYFVVESDGVRSAERWFVTAPEDARTFKLLYGGDSRSDREDRQLMNTRLREMLAEDEAIVALWHGGDFVDDGYDWVEWSEWLEDHEATGLETGRVLPIIPTRGNHEKDGSLFNRVFGSPGSDLTAGAGRDDNYFTTTVGGHTTLITLNSEGSSLLGDQRTWLERELMNAQSSRWIVAGYHTPAYPAVKIPGPTKTAWVDLFERYDVDLVCENDGHALKRTVPIREDTFAEDGVVYVGEGGLGVRQRTPDADRWYLQSPGVTMAAHHVQKLTFSEDALIYEAVGMGGEVLDRYTQAPRETRKHKNLSFHVERIELLRDDVLELQMSTTPEADSLRVEHVSVSPALGVDRVRQRTGDVSRLQIYLDGDLAQGTTYRIDLKGVRDVFGRDLQDTSLIYTVPSAIEASLRRQPGSTRGPLVANEDEAQALSSQPIDVSSGRNGCSQLGRSSAPSPVAPLTLLLLGVGATGWRRSRYARHT